MSWLSDLDDEDDPYADFEVRERPNPKANRARTKQRPEHADAVPARVLGVDRGRYRILVGEGGDAEHEATATRARELRNQAIVTGDLVDAVGDTSGTEGSLARIVRVHERSTVLRRSADDTDEVERVIVANADQLLIVVAAADPEPRLRLIDRYLVAAYDAGLAPILCVTKTDLVDPEPLLRQFAGLELEIVTSALGEFPLAPLRTLLAGHRTVAVGHSGVGKSTLVNALVPEANRATGEVNTVTGRGRHTSSSSVMLRVGDGWIIDTPGVRSFGLGHVDPGNILKGFPDLASIAAECPRGCTHLPGSPDCELVEGARDGFVNPARLDSLQRLLATFAAPSG